jgi:hypothetical protein
MAMELGALRPPPVYPAEVVIAEPELENLLRELLAELAAHMLPALSIANAKELLSPPPVKPVDGDSPVPALENLLRVFPWSTQTLPEPSIAIGPACVNPPPVYPAAGDRRVCEFEILLREKAFEVPGAGELEVQIEPKPSIATV